MPSVPIGVWGIDLGQCALKAVRLVNHNGEVTATAFDYIEHPKILSQPDADPDQLTRAALEQFLSRNPLKGDQIAISVPGQTGLARFVKLPPVEAKKIPDIVRFEAKQQIPFPLEEVVWDWQTIGSGGLTEEFVENEIGLFAMKRDMVNRYLQAFRDVNVEVHFVQMAPLAMCNYVTFDVLKKGGADAAGEGGEKGQCVVALDIGADNTNLIVTDGDRIIWQRPIPIGGNHFTRALTKDMKLTFAKAEHLKRNATKAEDPKKIFQSMKPVFSDFAGELQRSLGFFSNTHRQAQIQKVLGLGNAFRLPGLQKFLSQTLGVEVHKIDSFNRLKGDEVITSPVYSENILSFSVAYGLALQGIGAARLKTNLLPQEIQFERMIRSKKPWVAVAAASLLVGVTVFGFLAGSQFSVARDAATEATAQKRVIDNMNKLIKDFDEEQARMKKAREDARAMLCGGEERVNWAVIHRYINECLPQPDGKNMPSQLAYSKYVTDNAKKAYREKSLRDEDGIKEEMNVNELIQINLQAVWARYCNVPMATQWFNGTEKRSNWPPPMRHPDWMHKKPPAKPGWAMEVRGYTYHKDGIEFVSDTLLESLRSIKAVLSPLHDPRASRLKLEISHVAVLQHHSDTITASNNPGWTLIDKGLFLNDLVGTGGGSSTGSGGMTGLRGDSAPGGSGTEGATEGAQQSRSRGPWSGLGLGGGGGGGGTGGGIGTGAGGSGAEMPRGYGALGASGGGGASLPGIPSGGPSGSTGTAPQETKLKAGERKRTEFVIVFYWQEPLPSEPPETGGDLNASMEGGSGSPTGYNPSGYGGAGGGYRPY
jgi:type IV pilus assembly protein PilM